MKSSNSETARRIRLRAVVAYPAVSVALAASVALALTPFGTAQVMALGATTIPLATTAPTTTATATSATTTPAPTETTTPAPTETTTPSATPIPNPSVAVPPVDQYVLARIEGPMAQANYLPVDESVTDALPFQTFRVRFRLHNAGTSPTTLTPRLEYRAAGTGGYLVVPEEPMQGVPMHVAREWVPRLGLGGGTMQSELGEDIVAADLRIGKESGLAVNGHRSMGANPDRAVTLPSDSYTEQEFTVTLSIDAEYLTSYQLRITVGGTAMTGMQVAEIRLGPAPAVRLPPGQHEGLDVGAPNAIITAGVVK